MPLAAQRAFPVRLELPVVRGRVVTDEDGTEPEVICWGREVGGNGLDRTPLAGLDEHRRCAASGRKWLVCSFDLHRHPPCHRERQGRLRDQDSFKAARAGRSFPEYPRGPCFIPPANRSAYGLGGFRVFHCLQFMRCNS